MNFNKKLFIFLDLVDNSFYASPNRVVSKKERSSWRFKVKRYYKELNKILPDSKDGVIATKLLIEIFKRLSTGTYRLLFSSWDTFKALGVLQSEYYDVIMLRILSSGYTKENLSECIDLLDVIKDSNEYSYGMFWIFISNLKTISTKEMALELLCDKVDKLKVELLEIKDFNKEYYFKENINNYVECILEIFLMLEEYDNGKKYFKENYIESDNEDKEYIIFKKLEELNLVNEWIKEYESNVNKIKFRDSINVQYEKLKVDKSFEKEDECE